MPFQFGEATSIDPFMASIALISTIAFLAAGDYLTSRLEYYFRDSSVYTNMLQKLYRELMMMGKQPHFEKFHYNLYVLIDFICPFVRRSC
jgi:hypothetical protein